MDNICDIGIHAVKQWIALKACSDWGLKLQISFVIHLKATCMRFASENFVTIAGINQVKSSSCALLSQCFSIHQNNN